MRSFVYALGATLVLAACKEQPKPMGLVVDASSAIVVVDAGTPQVDISQCTGCAAAAAPAWQFVGVFSDDKCTVPLAQADVAACAMTPAGSATSLAYVDDFGAHKAGDTAQVTVGDQIAPEAPRFQKHGAKCVRANEVAVDVTPMGCAGQRICRDANGALACGTCRTFANSCPDLEETRLYATIVDAAKPATPGGNNNLARLKQCCAALAAQGAALGPSPEGGMLIAAGAQCSMLVAQAGPTGNAPELAAIRPLMATGKVPAVCAGL